MKINEVCRITGLSANAIRFYESKGLIKANRTDNSYRDYTERMAKELKRIKLLRFLGISIPQIAMLQQGLIELDDLLKKQIEVLDNSKADTLKKRELCSALLLQNGEDSGEVLRKFSAEQHTEIDECPQEEKNSSKAVAIGLDIGTSNLSAVICDAENGQIFECYTIPNAADLLQTEVWEAMQSVALIVEKLKKLLTLAKSTFPHVCSIGLTGQMHGIVYVDTNGQAVSDLYTWQDHRGNQPFRLEQTYCDYLNHVTGTPVATGFGCVTHFYLQENGILPPTAAKFCTIMDYFGMVLTGRKAPLVHVTNAASFGCFLTERNCFDEKALQKAGMDASYFPETTVENQVLGKYEETPVMIAIGDNQASFLGSAGHTDNGVLVNIGTGSQVTVLTPKSHVDTDCGLEVRPYLDGKYLLTYSALCGGSAYALLERFIRRIVVASGGENVPMYHLLNQLAEAGNAKKQLPLVDTSFMGRRQDPCATGKIDFLDVQRFTPECFAAAVLHGIVRELYENYEKMIAVNGAPAALLIASGNAVRKNSVLQQILADQFDMTLYLPDHMEEAAYGAALYSIRKNGNGSGYITLRQTADPSQSRKTTEKHEHVSAPL